MQSTAQLWNAGYESTLQHKYKNVDKHFVQHHMMNTLSFVSYSYPKVHERYGHLLEEVQFSAMDENAG